MQKAYHQRVALIIESKRREWRATINDLVKEEWICTVCRKYSPNDIAGVLNLKAIRGFCILMRNN